MEKSIAGAAHSVKPNPEFLSDKSAKDSKWDSHRANAQTVESIYTQNDRYTRLAERIADCSTWLQFGEGVDRGTGEVKLKLSRASFCCVRHCPVCSWRRNLRQQARFFEKIPLIKEQHPTARFLFLTLTVPNCEPDQLRSKISEMNKAWQRLIQRKDWPALGFIRTVEVTRSKTGQAHPHFHALLIVRSNYFSKNYITREQWLQNWRDAMRDQTITQVDIRTVKPKIEGQDLHAAVVETLKYSTKVTDAFADPNWLYHMTEQLHKLRFISSGGVLKDILSDDVTTEEMIAPGDEDKITADEQGRQLTFTWRPVTKKYAKKGT